VFFPLCKYALLSLRYNTSERKEHGTQKVPARGIFQSNAVSLQTNIFKNVAITLKNMHVFLQAALFLLGN
jgi:hypothetical protein